MHIQNFSIGGVTSNWVVHILKMDDSAFLSNTRITYTCNTGYRKKSTLDYDRESKNQRIKRVWWHKALRSESDQRPPKAPHNRTGQDRPRQKDCETADGGDYKAFAGKMGLLLAGSRHKWETQHITYIIYIRTSFFNSFHHPAQKLSTPSTNFCKFPDPTAHHPLFSLTYKISNFSSSSCRFRPAVMPGSNFPAKRGQVALD